MATLCSQAAAVICWSIQSKKEKKKKGRKRTLWEARGKYRKTFLLLGMPCGQVWGVCCHLLAQPAFPWAACDFLPKWKNKTEKREKDKSPSCRRCPMALLLSAPLAPGAVPPCWLEGTQLWRGNAFLFIVLLCCTDVSHDLHYGL